MENQENLPRNENRPEEAPRKVPEILEMEGLTPHDREIYTRMVAGDVKFLEFLERDKQFKCSVLQAEALIHGLRHGNRDMTIWGWSTRSFVVAAEKAIRCGDLPLLKMLVDHHYNTIYGGQYYPADRMDWKKALPSQAMAIAFESRHPKMIEYLLSLGIPMIAYPFEWAYELESPALVTWLMEKGYTPPFWPAREIAKTGSIRMVKFCIGRQCNAHDILRKAATYGKINILEWLHSAENMKTYGIVDENFSYLYRDIELTKQYRTTREEAECLEKTLQWLKVRGIPHYKDLESCKRKPQAN